MPRVRILTAISGVDVSYIRGDVADLPGPTAASWCAAGMAELVRGEAAETPERAEDKPETAASRSRASRTRKS